MTAATMEFREQSQRDVVFTPFMLRVRAAVQGELREPTVMHLASSSTESIAVAVHEWFELRTRAEHVIAEANGMLAEDAERIQLDDEYGTDELAFTISWRDRAVRLAVHADGRHAGHVQTTERGWSGHALYSADTKPANDMFLEDLAIALVSVNESTIVLDDADAQASTQEEEQ